MCKALGRDDGGFLGWTPLGEGVERVEARQLKAGFAPHSHDSYVIGNTVAGEQRFRYRRAERCAVPGQAFVLHPEEMHDGWPGTADGYGYRALHIAPRHIAEAAGRRALPFLREAVTGDRALRATITRGLAVPAGSEIGAAEVVADLAAALLRLCGGPPPRVPTRYAALERIREELHENWREGVAMAALEAEHGMSRFAIAREFRRCFGVSPSRYVILRRLDHARRLIAARESLAAAALASGFADQSHMSRHFLRAFGMSPGVWRDAMR